MSPVYLDEKIRRTIPEQYLVRILEALYQLRPAQIDLGSVETAIRELAESLERPDSPVIPPPASPEEMAEAFTLALAVKMLPSLDAIVEMLKTLEWRTRATSAPTMPSVIGIADPSDTNKRIRIDESGRITVNLGTFSGVASDTTLAELRDRTPRLVGTPFYRAGTGASTVTLTAGQRLLGLSVWASGADGSFTVDGGDPVTVRANSGRDWNTLGNYVAPTIVFTGPLDWLVEGVA